MQVGYPWDEGKNSGLICYSRVSNDLRQYSAEGPITEQQPPGPSENAKTFDSWDKGRSEIPAADLAKPRASVSDRWAPLPSGRLGSHL